MNYGLFQRNARACEKAIHKRCTCVCGGALHGVSHAAKMQELWDAYQARERTQIEEGEKLPGAAP